MKMQAHNLRIGDIIIADHYYEVIGISQGTWMIVESIQSQGNGWVAIGFDKTREQGVKPASHLADREVEIVQAFTIFDKIATGLNEACINGAKCDDLDVAARTVQDQFGFPASILTVYDVGGEASIWFQSTGYDDAWPTMNEAARRVALSEYAQQVLGGITLETMIQPARDALSKS